MFRAELTGGKQLEDLLAHLRNGAARAANRAALTAASAPLMADMRGRLTPGQGLETGILRRAIGRKVKSYRSGTSIVAVGVRTGRKQIIARTRTGLMAKIFGKSKAVVYDPARVAHLVEFGTKPHATGGGAKIARRGRGFTLQFGLQHPGARPRPFIRPAGAAQRDNVLAVYRAIIKGRIVAAARKFGAR